MASRKAAAASSSSSSSRHHRPPASVIRPWPPPTPSSPSLPPTLNLHRSPPRSTKGDLHRHRSSSSPTSRRRATDLAMATTDDASQVATVVATGSMEEHNGGAHPAFSSFSSTYQPASTFPSIHSTPELLPPHAPEISISP